MKKLCSLLIAILLMVSNIAAFAYEDTPVNMKINGKAVSFSLSPFIRDGVTYVDIKALAEKIGFSFTAYPGHSSVVISNGNTSACFTPGEEYATVVDMSGNSDEEFSYRKMVAPCMYINSHLVVPAKDVAVIFGYVISYDPSTLTVYFGFSPDMISSSTRSTVNGQAYYFQNEREFNLPSYGSGYCWTCCYAMLISNVTGLRITPNDVAAINMAQNGKGAYCYHSEIVSQLGVRFASALPLSSPYYGGRDVGSGGTFILNPNKDDSVARAALKEALQLHPEGVMVRYDGFPHTVVAVAYEGELILFNDPAPSGSGTYSDTGKYQGVPFSETCLASKGFTLSDLTFIQAIDPK